MKGVELQVVSSMMHSYAFMPNLLFSPRSKRKGFKAFRRNESCSLRKKRKAADTLR